MSSRLPPPPIEEVMRPPPADRFNAVSRDAGNIIPAAGASGRDASELNRQQQLHSNTAGSSSGGAAPGTGTGTGTGRSINRDAPLTQPISPVIPAIRVIGKANMTETEILDNIVFEIMTEVDSILLTRANGIVDRALTEAEARDVEDEVFAQLYRRYDEQAEAGIKRTLPTLATNWAEGYDCLEVRKRLLSRGLNTKRGKIYHRNIEIMANRAARKESAERFWRSQAQHLYVFTEGFRNRLPMPRAHLQESIDRHRGTYEKAIERYPGGADGAFEFSQELPEDCMNEVAYAEKAERFYEHLTSTNNHLVELQFQRFQATQYERISAKLSEGIAALVDSVAKDVTTTRADYFSEDEMVSWRAAVQKCLGDYKEDCLQVKVAKDFDFVLKF